MKKKLYSALAGCMLAGALTAAGMAAGARAAENVEWVPDKDGWSISGTGADAVYTAPEKNFLSGIKTKKELTYNCIEYDIRALDMYGSVDGNVGFCYTCGDTEYFFELNTVNGYLRIRRMKPSEALKTSNTGFSIKQGKWYHFKIIVAPGLLRWYIDGDLVSECKNTKECNMEKGYFYIQGYNAQPQVKNIVLSNEEVTAIDYDFEFDSPRSSKMFTWEPLEGGDAADAEQARAEDGEYIWPLSGSLTSAILDTSPGDAYSMLMPLRNTLCVRMKNDSDATKLKVSFTTDLGGTYGGEQYKVFDILPRSGYYTYYFNLSDVKGAKGYLRGFKLEAVDAREGTAYIDAITFEREAKVYDYAGSIAACRTDGTDVTVKGTLKPEYAGATVKIYETSITNYAFAKNKMKKIAEADADGTDFTVTFPLMNNKLTRLSSHFFAEVNGVFVSPWFTVENYYDLSENPYRFDIPMNLDVNVTESPYNARGDGFTNDTTAIQRAIDDVSKAGGGRVVIPGDDSVYGKRYIITTLNVKSNVWLYIDAGAVLWQSPRKADYPYEPVTGHDVSIPGINWTHAGLCHNYPLVMAQQAHNFKITGKGMLRLNDLGSECEDGVNGGTIWTGCENRIHLIALALVECNDAQISGITIHRANCYHLNLFACSRVYISDVTMNEATCASGDGIGLSAATHDVKVDRCFLFSNDDAVTMTSSYNDPRGLVWWHAKTDRDNSVRNVEVCHSDLFGGHGLTFITWGTDNPDLSKQEIYNVRAYDNVLSGGASVGTWCDNPYYGGPFTNEDPDDYSPVRDVQIFNNKYQTQCSLLTIKPTSLLTDCKIYSASDFQNGDLERRNGQDGWVSGLSNWSCLGDRTMLSVLADEADGKTDHRALQTGDTFMYQGLYFKQSTVTVTFDLQVFGTDAAFLIVDAESGSVLVKEPLADSGSAFEARNEHEFAQFSWTGALEKGTYYIGVRTAGDTKVIANNFKAVSAKYDEAQAVNAAGTGDIIAELIPDKSVLRVPTEPVTISMPRFIADTLPAADRTPGEVVHIDPNGSGDDPGQNGSDRAAKGLSLAAKVGIITGCVAAAIASVLTALFVVKKRKGK